jgi:hypothetical protein
MDMDTPTKPVVRCIESHRIEAIRQYAACVAGRSSSVIAQHHDVLQALELVDYGPHLPEAEAAKADTLAKLKTMYIATKASEEHEAEKRSAGMESERIASEQLAESTAAHERLTGAAGKLFHALVTAMPHIADRAPDAVVALCRDAIDAAS